MIIKIEIDVKPEELRTFAGLPDVAGLQEDALRYVRDRISQGGAEDFDLAAFVRDTTRSSTRAWQRLFSAAFSHPQDTTEGSETGDTAADSEGPPSQNAGAAPRTGSARRSSGAAGTGSRSRGAGGRAKRESNDEG